MTLSLIAAGVTGGFLFAFLMPYMPSPGWTLSIVFCYALGSVAFLNAYALRKKKRDQKREAARWRKSESEEALKNAVMAGTFWSGEEADDKTDQGEQAEMKSLREDLKGIEKAIAEYNEYIDQPESRDPEKTIDELIAQWSRKEKTIFKSLEP